MSRNGCIFFVPITVVAPALFMIAMLLPFASGPAHCSDSLFPVELPQGNIALLGVGAYPDYFGSDDYAIGALPVVRFKWGDTNIVTLMGNELRCNLLPGDHWRSGPVGLYRFSRRDVDDEVVDRMNPIDGTIELGGFIHYQVQDPDDFRKSMGIGAWALHDVAHVHGGSVRGANAFASYPVFMPFTVAAGVGATWGDRRYMNTYFGVDEADALLSGLDTYHPGSGLRDSRVWMTGILHLGLTWHTGFGLLYSRLKDGSAESPLVKERGSADQWIYGVGMAYVW